MFVFFIFLCICYTLEFSLGQDFTSRIDFSESDLVSGSCVLPQPPRNGNYSLLSDKCTDPGGCWAAPGKPVPDTTRLSFSCSAGYSLQANMSSAIVACNNGPWSHTFPECQEITCEPLISPSVILTCKNGDSVISCNSSLPIGTTATAKCREYYRQTTVPEYTSLVCQANGEWNRPPFECEAECGLALPPGDTTAPQHGFPWSASILRLQENGTWTAVCLGTLITPQIVITDQYCADKAGRNWTNELLVGLGVVDRKRYYFTRKINENIDRHLYSNWPTKVGMDLAFLRLVQSVMLSAYVMPVCLDLDQSLTLSASSELHISAWINDLLVTGVASYIDGYSCKSQGSVTEVYAATIDVDTFCGNITIGGFPGNDSYGAGVTIVRDNQHYVVGVFSNGAGENVNVYTSLILPENMDWLEHVKYGFENVNNYDYNCTDDCWYADPLIALPQPALSSEEDPDKINGTSVIVDPSKKSCSVPDLNNRVFTKYNCRNGTSCNRKSGDIVPHGELLAVSCLDGNYLVLGVNKIVFRIFVSCQNGSWDPNLPQCYILCPPLFAPTMDLECQQGLAKVQCDKPMLPETTVEYSCKPYYKTSETFHKRRMKCNADGTWSRELPNCTAACGVSNLNSAEIKPAIVGGKYSKPGYFPWHTAIYHKDLEDGTWEAKCGGTLVSTRHVLTAAHCVTKQCLICKPPPLNIEDVMVAFGKNRRDFNTAEDNGVTREIKQIEVHPFYVGNSINYFSDIAVLVLKTDVVVNSYVVPVCMDFSERNTEALKRDKTRLGYVAGWGNTEECASFGNICNTPSDILKYIQTTINDFNECYNTTQHIKAFSISRLTPDKFCAGNGSVSVVQQGDSGGGLTFVFDGLHYIYGIVSVKLRMQQKEKFYYSFGAFTNVTYYLPWLNNVLY